VIVTEYVPDGAFEGTNTVTVDEPTVLMDCDPRVTLEPAGRFDDALNDTTPLKLLNGLTFTLNGELLPAAMDIELTFELMLKYGPEPLIRSVNGAETRARPGAFPYTHTG
jgi:hypothetical protein